MRYAYSAIQKIIEFRWKKHTGAKVLMFHHISDDENSWEDESISISKTGFRACIERLEEQKYQFITIDGLGESLNEKMVCITFDDIFASAYENAIPYLREKKIPYCVFVSDCYLDQDGFITSEQFEELAKDPLCTIGFHTKNHLMMRQISKEKIQKEMECGKEMNFFAFPYGSVYALTSFSIKEAKQRFQYVFSTISAECSEEWKKHYGNFFPRINVCEKNYKQLLEGNKK